MFTFVVGRGGGLAVATRVAVRRGETRMLAAQVHDSPFACRAASMLGSTRHLPTVSFPQSSVCRWSGRHFSSSSSLDGFNVDSVLLTPKCSNRINALTATSTANSSYLRISVESGGCSGFQYKFNLEEDAIDEEEDHVFERDGARVVCDDVSYEFLKGSTVDFEEEMIRSSFAVVNNPNMESGCGCGVSFAPKM